MIGGARLGVKGECGFQAEMTMRSIFSCVSLYVPPFHSRPIYEIDIKSGVMYL